MTHSVVVEMVTIVLSWLALNFQDLDTAPLKRSDSRRSVQGSYELMLNLAPYCCSLGSPGFSFDGWVAYVVNRDTLSS